MIRNITRISDSSSILHVRLDEVNLIDLLEGLLGGLAEVIGATDEDHRPAIRPGIGDSTDGVGVSWPRDAEAEAGDSSEIASVTCTIASLLLVPAAIVIDAVALDGKAELNDRNT